MLLIQNFKLYRKAYMELLVKISQVKPPIHIIINLSNKKRISRQNKEENNYNTKDKKSKE